MDLVDEKDVAEFEIGENRGQVAFELNQRPGCGAEMRAHFVGDDGSQRRLAETRRTIKQNVIERLAAFPGGLDRDIEVVFDVLLADVLRENARTKRQFECRLFVEADPAMMRFDIFTEARSMTALFYFRKARS